MALISNLQLPGIALPTANSAKQALIAEFWRWFDARRAQVVFTRKIWFVSITVTYAQLEPVFVQIFGTR